MEAGRFTKKPVTIEAKQYHGTREALETRALLAWLEEHGVEHRIEQAGLYINTLEGDMLARLGWWIIRGVQGEFYPCAPDIFEATYRRADEEDDQPLLGLATTRQLLEELTARAEINGYAEYRTVDA